MSDMRRANAFFLVIAAGLCTEGCGGPASPDPSMDRCEVSPSRWQAADDTWAAVGAVAVAGDRDYSVVCTATLVAPRIILTAKHCTDHLPESSAYFALGPNVNSPRRLVALSTALLVPPDTGGFLALGSDTAFYVLAEDILDIAPIPISSEPLDIEESLLTVGVGEDSAETGARHVGAQHVMALTGNVPGLIFGDEASCLAGRPFVPGTDSRRCDATSANPEDCRGYDEATLLTGYEVWAGDSPGDAQTCFGDSGGPLIRQRNGASEIVGVTSWGWWSSDRPCAYGTVFALVTNETKAAFARLRDEP